MAGYADSVHIILWNDEEEPPRDLTMASHGLIMS